MRSTLLALSALVFICIGLAGSALASTSVSSDFQSGNDGWSWLDADPGISWESFGGNPDGYMQYDNNIPYGMGATASIYAPSEFLGNWLDSGITGFSYEAKIFTTGDYVSTGTYHAFISGPGGEFNWQGPTPDPSAGWLLIEVPLIESEWISSSGSGNWEATLSDVTLLRIGMAYYTNANQYEITGIDNVLLHVVPIPGSFSLLYLGLSIFSYLTRKFGD